MSLGSVVGAETPLLATVDGAAPGRLSRQLAVDAVAALDLMAVAAAGFLPAHMYTAAGGPAVDWQHVGQSSLIAGLLTVLCLKAGDSYDASRVHDFPVEPRRISANVLMGTAAMMGLGMPASAGTGDWWIWLAVWFLTAAVPVIAIHAAARGILRRLTLAGRFDRRVAVFGAGPIARRIFDHIDGNDLGARFAGLWDDRKDQDRIEPMGLTVDGRLADLVAAARAGRIDQVIIALPQAADGRIADIARQFDDTGASVHIVTHIASDVVGKPRAHNVSNIGHVGLLDVRKRDTAAGWRGLFTTA